MKREAMTVLGVDPGLANVGLGVVREQGRDASLVHASLVRTQSSTTLSERLAHIHDQVVQLIRETRPDALAIEGQYFHRQREASFKVGQSVGVVLLAAHQHALPVFEYGPMEVKQALVGNGRADKQQVAFMVRALLGGASLEVSHHASDALALALTHLAHRRITPSAPLVARGRAR